MNERRGEPIPDWLTGGDDAEIESGRSILAQGATLRELHALRKAKNPANQLGGLVRVQNKGRDFLWVHPQFSWMRAPPASQPDRPQRISWSVGILPLLRRSFDFQPRAAVFRGNPELALRTTDLP